MTIHSYHLIEPNTANLSWLIDNLNNKSSVDTKVKRDATWWCQVPDVWCRFKTSISDFMSTGGTSGL